MSSSTTTRPASRSVPFAIPAKLIDSIRANICGKVTRELLPGTLQAHRLNHYGAVELATHRFLHPDDATNIGEAETVMLWQWKDGAWKITRVISYDHHAATK